MHYSSIRQMIFCRDFRAYMQLIISAIKAEVNKNYTRN